MKFGVRKLESWGSAICMTGSIGLTKVHEIIFTVPYSTFKIDSAHKQPIERTHVQLYPRCQPRSVFTPLSHMLWSGCTI